MFMYANSSDKVRDFKGETRIPVRMDAGRITASSIQHINLNLVMSPTRGSLQNLIWVTDRQL